MKYLVAVGGKEFTVEIDSVERSARIGESLYRYFFLEDQLFVNDHPVVYDCMRDETGGAKAVLFSGKCAQVDVSRHGASAAAKIPKGEIHAPLNGQVVRLAVCLHDKVDEGQVILTLEAMKMENEITAPFKGIVAELGAREKDIVKAGELLCKIEPREIRDTPY